MIVCVCPVFSLVRYRQDFDDTLSLKHLIRNYVGQAFQFEIEDFGKMYVPLTNAGKLFKSGQLLFKLLLYSQGHERRSVQQVKIILRRSLLAGSSQSIRYLPCIDPDHNFCLYFGHEITVRSARGIQIIGSVDTVLYLRLYILLLVVSLKLANGLR